MKAFLVSLSVLLLFATTVEAKPPIETIPQFNFYKLNHEVFTEKSVKPGKKTLFVFFDSECEHCQRAANYLNKHYNELRSVNIYMVTLDDVSKIKSFMATYCPDLLKKKNVVLLQDLRNEFITQFSPRKYPSIFLFSVKKKLIGYEDEESKISKLLALVQP